MARLGAEPTDGSRWPEPEGQLSKAKGKKLLIEIVLVADDHARALGMQGVRAPIQRQLAACDPR